MGLSAHDSESTIAAHSNRISRRLLLIGWQGAEARLILTLLKAGRLPYLNSLLERGAQIELAVPRPANAVSAWTSLATGKRPHEHGILHSHVPTADGRGLEPISNRYRQCPAIWNYLGAAELQTHVVGWPVSFPAETVTGVCVADQIAIAANSDPRGSVANSWVAPSDLQAALRSQFIAPAQIDEITVGQMLPRSAKGLSILPQLIAGCRSILAETATYFRILRWCIGERPWDFAAGVFPGLRRAHELALWLERVAPDSSDCAKDLVAGCYEHHDLLLGQLLLQIDDAHLIALALGNHGAGNEAAHGIAAVTGPTVRTLPGTTRGNVLDFAPTVLAVLGVTAPTNMPGRPWTELFDRGLEPPTLTADMAQHFNSICTSTHSSASPAREAVDLGDDPAVEHLRRLGYVDPREVAECERVRNCAWTMRFHRAISCLDAGLLNEAIEELEGLVEHQPNSHQARATLAEALLRANRRREARHQITWLRFHGSEQPQVYRLAAALELADRNFDAALLELRGTRRGTSRCAGADALEGDVWLRKREPESARKAYQAAIDREGPTRASLTGLAAVELNKGNFEAAARYALDVLSTDLYCSRAHYYLAVALLQLEKPIEAIRALEAWAAVEPQVAAPYRWMARAYEQQLLDSARAGDCRRRGREIVRSRKSLRSRTADDTSTLSSPP